ncbi:CRE-PBO-5 protein, partial [Aphelenchoides avenae]
FTTSNERQERFSLGITSILTSAVLSLVVAEKVPHSSTAVPLLVAYFLFNMVLISVAAITTGFVMWVHRLGRHGDEPPNWLLIVFLLAPKDREKKKPFDHESVGLKSSSNHHSLDSNENECNGGIPEWPKVLTGRPASGLDAATYWRICSLEASVKRLCDIWHSLKAEMDLGTADYHRAQQLRRESNGYVRIARRIDIILELFFLTILTIPVVYLFMYTFRASAD